MAWRKANESFTSLAKAIEIASSKGLEHFRELCRSKPRLPSRFFSGKSTFTAFGKFTVFPEML
jgi:hypothetical protein